MAIDVPSFAIANNLNQAQVRDLRAALSPFAHARQGVGPQSQGMIDLQEQQAADQFLAGIQAKKKPKTKADVSTAPPPNTLFAQPLPTPPAITPQQVNQAVSSPATSTLALGGPPAQVASVATQANNERAALNNVLGLIDMANAAGLTQEQRNVIPASPNLRPSVARNALQFETGGLLPLAQARRPTVQGLLF